MASEYENLKESIVENLKQRGLYKKYEASIRRAIFEGIIGIDSGSKLNPNPNSSSYNILLLNELIRDYLRFQGYTNSLACLELESNLPKTVISRSELADELNVNDSLISPQIPLIFGIALKNRLHQNENEPSLSDSPIAQWKVLGEDHRKGLLNPKTEMMEHFDENGGFTFQKPIGNSN